MHDMQKSFRGYELIRKLGEGGMSDVFLAYSATQQCEVALKVLRSSAHQDPEMLRRFFQEHAVLASLKHRHVLSIYDQGFTDDDAYIAMEYLIGGTLQDEIRARGTQGNAFSGTVSQVHSRVIDLLRQIVSALDAIHQLGWVYRDLKPSNLIFRNAGGELVLVDFGIVKNVGELAIGILPERGPIAASDPLIGTPYYVSPEQATGQDITHRSDFYSLGVILFEMLTGERPYRGDSLHELLSRHLHAEIPRLPSEHASFQMLLDRLMAKQAIDRPEDTSGILRSLDILAKNMGN